MDEAINSGSQARFPLIPPETQAAMRQDRMDGMTLEEIAKKYGVSINSVRKYCGDIIKPRSSQVEVKGEHEINSEVEKAVLSQHAGRILDYSKKRDSDVIAAGEAVQRHLQEKGINVDINQIPPLQLIKLIKSPLGDDMNINVKSIFENWLEQQLSNPKTVTSEKSGKLSFEDAKEILMLKFLMKMAGEEGSQNNTAQWQQVISENEKLRQDLREVENNRKEDLDKLERKMQDLLFEKKIQTIEERQVNMVNSLSTQFDDLNRSIANLKEIPAHTPDPKTFLEEATKAASDLNKLKSTLIQMGLVSAAPGTPVPTMDVPDAFKNPDGSVNTIPYVIGRLADVAKPAIEAHFKKTPEQGEFVETPPPERRWTAAEYAEYLLGRPTLSPQEQQWLTNYRDYLLQQGLNQAAPQAQADITQPAQQTLVTEPVKPAEQSETPKKQEETTEELPAEPKTDIVKQMQEQEAKQAQNLEGVI